MTEEVSGKAHHQRLSDAHSRELGSALKEVRRKSPVKTDDLLKVLEWSPAKLSKLEAGVRGTSNRDISEFLGMCQASRHDRERVYGILATADRSSFVRVHDDCGSTPTLVLHEDVAETVTTYEPFSVPPLARTREYASALNPDARKVEALMRRREWARKRASVLARKQRQVFYLHETALRTAVGTPAVMRDQLLALTLLAGAVNTVVRVVPLSAPLHEGLLRPATLLEIGPNAKPLACAESDFSTVFHDDPVVVGEYRKKLRAVESAALNTAESRALLAHWADLYDRDTV